MLTNANEAISNRDLPGGRVAAHDLFTFLALAMFIAAAVVAFIQRSWMAGLFCLGVTFAVLAGAGLVTA